MNEFVARNGLIALDSSSISGPFVVTGSIYASSGITTLGSIAVNSFGGTIQTGNLFSFYSSNANITSLGSLTITHAAPNSVFIQKPANITSATGDFSFLYINSDNRSFVPTTGSSTLSVLRLTPVVSQSGEANGITRGLYISPNIINAADFRAIQWDNNAVTAPSASWGLYGVGSAPNFLSGSLGIGTTSPTAKLDVRGTTFLSGSVTGSMSVLTKGITTGSSGYSLRAENLNGSQGLIIRDDGAVVSIGSTASGRSLVWGNNSTAGSISSHIVLGDNNSSAASGGGVTNAVVGNYLSTTSTISYLFGFGLTNGTSFRVMLGTGTNSGYFTSLQTSNMVLQGGTNPYIALSTQESIRLIISDSGSVGIGTTSPSFKLDVSGSLRTTSTAIITGSLIATGKVESNEVLLGSNENIDKIYIGALGAATYGIRGFQYSGTLTIAAGYLFTGGKIVLYGQTAAGGLASGILMNSRVGINTSPTTYALDTSGSFRVYGNITATSGSDYFDISHEITQPAQTGSQIYEVNITPTLRYTAPNQTQTALRVAATFTGSTALSSSQSNIIADFGSTSAGSQFLVNDVTSGSIYMVNDVSGLPIIEANSNWDVLIYDYPNVVLRKTGSLIDITGILRVSGSSIFIGTTNMTGSLVITGSTTSTLGFTGSLFGTSSWTLNIDGGFY